MPDTTLNGQRIAESLPHAKSLFSSDSHFEESFPVGAASSREKSRQNTTHRASGDNHKAKVRIAGYFLF